VRFRVLGPVDIETDDGRVLTPSRRRERCLLGVLLLEPGRVVPAHRLADLLWDGQPPEHARRALYAHVARVRALLAECDAALVSHGGGYLLRVDPGTVDAHQFRELVQTDGATADLARRYERLRTALGLWRGPALHNAATDRLRERLCVDLEELRLHAVEESMANGLALGRHGELVSELARVTAAHPLRSRLVRLYMIALHHTGRTAEAVDVYAAARVRLADELGLDPDPEMRRLHQAILREEPVPRSDLPPPRPASTGVLPIPAQLPPDPAGFTGREMELETLDKLLRADHEQSTATVIATITGTAGVGKTAHAVHWAHRVRHHFPDGQLYVNLRGFDPAGTVIPPADAIRGFLDALGVETARIPATLHGQAGLYRTLLANRKMLVLLDNARDADQVRPLLPGAPGCVVIVTSRNRLTGLVVAQGAHLLPLDALTTDEARTLLVRRVGAARVAAEPRTLDQIISWCCRLPLALAIVAAWAASHPRAPLAVLAADLRVTHRRLDALATDDPTTDIRAVLHASYRALTPQAAQLFRLLGLHPGPDISAPAAASLAGLSPPRTRRLLAELARAHLIAEQTPGRYTSHDLLRVYAAELAHSTGTAKQRHDATRRILDHYVHTAHAAARILDPDRAPIPLALIPTSVAPEEPSGWAEAMSWFNAERHVLLNAIEHAARTGLPTHAWQLAWALMHFLDRRGFWHELDSTGRAAVAAAQQLAHPAAEAMAYRMHARGALRLGHHHDGHRHLQRALDLYRQAGDPVTQAKVHVDLAVAHGEQAAYAEALHHAQLGLAKFRAAGHHHGEANALYQVGWWYSQLGDHEQALVCGQQAIIPLQQLGQRAAEAEAWANLGYAHHHLGHHRRAIACYRQALPLSRETGDRLLEATTLTAIGDIHDTAGNRQAARIAWRQAHTILDQLDRPEAATVRAKLARTGVETINVID
jgi:DNA-binding SARP family transcriptional activator/tetratricopeptide (TPR) repeat protein